MRGGNYEFQCLYADDEWGWMDAISMMQDGWLDGFFYLAIYAGWGISISGNVFCEYPNITYPVYLAFYLL